MATGTRSRLLAVMFVDQVGSTATLQQVGDLGLDDIRSRSRDILDEAIVQSGGRVMKDLGDGRMAVFESASDAINGAIAIQTRSERDHRLNPSKPRLRYRVGISAGDVTESADDVHGTTVVEAARLESKAPESGILCTDLARSLAGSRTEARFDERIEVDAKGFDHPIPAWVVGWEPSTAAVLPPIPTALGAGGRYGFAGRGDELAEVERVWSSCLAGESNGLLIAGEPGVGKSRLARELAVEAHRGGALVLHGRCDEGVGAPFQSLAAALEYYVTQVRPEADGLGRFGGELRRIVPDLDVHVGGLPPMVHADAETEQYRLFDAVLSWLETASTEVPVLVVVDDIHWAAQPTLDMLRHLLRRTPGSQLGIVCTYRDTAADESSRLLRFLGDVQREGSVHSLALTGLDAAGVRSLLSSVGLDPDGELGDDLVDRLLRQTAGNAFFLGELVSVIDERGLDELDQSASEALGQVVLDRVSRLSESAAELLAAASISSGEVSLDVLSIASGRSRAELVDAAEDCLRAGLLVEVPGALVRYRFQHDLVRSTLYDSMSFGRRSQRHHDMAHAIEEVHRNHLDDLYDDLAYHYARSADPADTDRAIEVTQAAGDRAAGQLGYTIAVKHYENALALMDRPGCTEPEERRARIKLGLGVAMKHAGVKNARAMLFDAAESAFEHDDPNTVVQAALANTRGFFSSAGRTDHDRVRVLEMALDVVDPDDSSHRAKLMANLAVELTFGDEHERRRQLADEALSMAERLGDPVCLAHILAQRIGYLWNAAGLGERLRLCERLQEIVAHLQAPQWSYTAASSQFQAAMEAGDLALADRCLDQMRTTVEELRQPVVISYLRMRESVRAIVAGDLDAGERLATECFEMGQAAGQPDALTFYFGQLVNLRFHQGRLEELEAIVAAESAANPGLPALQAALALIRCETDDADGAREPFVDLVDRHDTILDDLSWLLMTALLADVCFQLDDRTRAVRLHAALEPYRGQCVDNATNWFGSVAQYLGMLEHTMGRYADADASFAAARDWHARMPAPLLLARTEMNWARSLLVRPDPDGARAAVLLESSREVAEQRGLGAVLRRASSMSPLS